MPEPDRRGGCLPAFIAFVLLVNTVAVVYYADQGFSGRGAWQGVPEWQCLLRALVSTASIVFVLAVACRRRWGVIGFAAVPIVSVLLAPAWDTVRRYPLSAPGPLVALGCALGALVLYLLTLRHILTRAVWTASDTVVLVCLGLAAMLLALVPGLAVSPFNLTATETPAAGLLAGMLLALLVRPAWNEMR